MKRRYSRLLGALAVAAMGTLMESGCYIGTQPDEGNNCWFLCEATENPQTPAVNDTPQALWPAASGQPA